MEKILIGIPNRGSLNPLFVDNLLKLKLPKNYITEFNFVASYNIDCNRNELAKQVYADLNIKYLFFLDDDIIVPEDGLLNLLESPSYITSGIYRFKESIYQENIPVIMPINKYNEKRFGRMTIEEFNNALNDGNRYFITEGIGMGCCLINRCIFENIPYPYFNFHQGDIGMSGIGEDLHFCRLVYYYMPYVPILVDKKVDCKHLLTHSFPL